MRSCNPGTSDIQSGRKAERGRRRKVLRGGCRAGEDLAEASQVHPAGDRESASSSKRGDKGATGSGLHWG